jgi:N-acetyl sugar amidotransferase
MKSPEQVCARCVMDTTDPNIRFDEDGFCNHCCDAMAALERVRLTPEESQGHLDRIAANIKKESRGKPYDCLIGLSGGVDSSYVAYLAKQMGLRPVAVHFDNGWNSDLAVSNIEKIVKKLGFDLMTYVIDWEEFRDLQRAFIRASVVDIEMLTDHAIVAAMFNLAKKHKVRYVLSGSNIATENCMPSAWVWRKQDLRNIKGIHRRFGERPLESFPTLASWQYMPIRVLGLGPTYVELLNYANYRKHDAMQVLEKELDWCYYGGKHYESVFTKFYQAHILPQKFGIDKRKVHWSSLVLNGEVTREEALAELAKPLYDETELRHEREYVLKKLGFTEEEFDEIMRQPPRPHDFYPSDEKIVAPLLKLYRRFRRRRSLKSS